MNIVKAVMLAAGALALGLVRAEAADLPVKAPPPAPVAMAYNWTGFYIGGHVGGMRARSSLGSVNDVVFPGFATTGLPALAPIVIVPSRFATLGGVSGSNTGFIGGGQIGYNWQIGRFLLGFESDASWMSARAGVTQNVIDPFAFQTLTGTYSTKIDWTASFRGRLGATFDRVLLYVTGGGAYIDGDFNSAFVLVNPTPGIFFPIPFSGATSASSSFDRLGWTVGAGVEWAFADNWSIAGEYRHSDFGRTGVRFAVTDPDPARQLGIVPLATNMRLTTDQATLRLNYRFNAPAPVVGRP